MKQQWLQQQLQRTTHDILLEAGYHYFVDPKTRKPSYVMRLGRQYYPRMHVYIQTQGEFVEIDLHLDQKHASYEGQKMHSGEYDGPVVEEEMARIARWMEHYRRA